MVKQRLLTLGMVTGILVISGAAVLGLGLPARGGTALAQEQTTAARTLTAEGSGEVRVQPDQATISLGVESRGQDAKTALADNATKMNAVLAAVKSQGIADAQIQTNGLSLYYDAERTTYVATHTLTVQLNEIDRVGSLLDIAVSSGANNSWGVTYGLKDTSAARSQALKAAIADARARADDMAAALNVHVVSVASAEDATYGYSPQSAKLMAGSGSPTQPGQLTVTSGVRVAYTFGS